MSHGSGIVSFIMGNSVVAPPAQQVGHGSLGIIGADVNGDGRYIVTPNSYDRSASIPVNHRRGSFRKEVRYPSADSRSLVAADFDATRSWTWRWRAGATTAPYSKVTATGPSRLRGRTRRAPAPPPSLPLMAITMAFWISR